MSNKLKTTIGLEIHVQLKTKSKMFCRCDNDAQGKTPNTTVCPICLGYPGALPVANEQAVVWTIKTGLALGCKINKIAKFDRKHYFYPDLPKGYQISQYDEPFCLGGLVEVDGKEIRLNRIHLEEDAGKLIHRNGKSLVDLNRAGTPLMEIVSEPDIESPKQAGNFLRKLQKIVRDIAKVSEASMEKGHLRCDANISVSDDQGHMSQIVEIKNLNSFKFVEKALFIEEEKLSSDYENWPKKVSKATHGYDSVKNITYLQRVKEEAADYRYFPEPDLPPFDTSKYNFDELVSELGVDEEKRISDLMELGISKGEAEVLISASSKLLMFELICKHSLDKVMVAKTIVNNYFGFEFDNSDKDKAAEYGQAVDELFKGKISKSYFTEVVTTIHKEGGDYSSVSKKMGDGIISNEDQIITLVQEVLSQNASEVQKYKEGRTQLMGFFMGQVMQRTKGKADAKLLAKILFSELNK